MHKRTSHISGDDLTKNSITICILFFEKTEQTKECIRSFLPANLPIRVLNNGSSPENAREMDLFCAQYASVRLEHAPTNLGTSRGKNILWRGAQTEWIFFVDNDITIQPGEWRPMAEKHLDQYGAVDVFLPLLYAIPEMQEARLNPATMPSGDGEIAVPCFSGGAALMSRRFLSRMNGFSEAIFIVHEDWELAIRAAKAGVNLTMRPIPEILLIHEHVLPDNVRDERAAKQRYSLEEAWNSQEYIRKEHGVAFESAEAWTRKQQDFFSGKEAVACALTPLAPIRAKICLSGLPQGEKILKRYPDIEHVEIVKDAERNGCIPASFRNALAGRPARLNVPADFFSDVEKWLDQIAPYAVSVIFDNSSWVRLKTQEARLRALRDRTASENASLEFRWTLSKDSFPLLQSFCEWSALFSPDSLTIDNYCPGDFCREEERERIVSAKDAHIARELDRLSEVWPFVVLPKLPDLAAPGCTCTSFLTTATVDGAGRIGGCEALCVDAPVVDPEHDDPFNAPPFFRARRRILAGATAHPGCLYCPERTRGDKFIVYPEPSAQDVADVEQSGLFDEAWYRKTYLLGREEVMPPVVHFLRFGVAKGYRPNKEFSPLHYLSEHPHVARDGMHPLLHHIRSGKTK